MSKRKTRKSQPRPQYTSKSQPYTKSVSPPKKVRGGWLTAALIFIAVHAVFTAVLLLLYRQPSQLQAPVLWTAAVLVALAEIGGAVGMWFWKRWGLYLFVGAILAGIVVGFLAFPTQPYVAFHGIIPVLILGYILQRQNKLRLLE